jgi:WD40 repeat protein
MPPVRLLSGLLLAALALPAPAADRPTLTIDAGGHIGFVWKVLFTKDGQQLITVGEDRTVRVWDAATGETVRVYRPPIGEGSLGALRAAALSPSGELLAVSGYTVDDAVYLISLASGQLQRVLKGHDNVVFALAFSPDGKSLVSGSADQTARLWDVATGKCEQVLTGHTDRIMDAAFSQDGKHVATASYDRTVRVWSPATGKRTAELTGHAAEVSCLAFSRDGDHLATGSKDQSVRLWTVRRDFAPGKKFERLGAAITSVCFNRQATEVLFTRGTGDSHDCSLLDLATGKERLRFRKHDNTVFHGTLSPDGTLAASAGGNDSETYLWKTRDGAVVRRLAARSRTPWSAAWSAAGHRIAWGNEPDGRLERTFALDALELGGQPAGAFVRARLRRDGQPITLKRVEEQALVQQGDKTLCTIDLGDYEVPRCVSVVKGDRVAVGTSAGLYLHEVKTGKRVRQFSGAGHVWAVAPSPDDRFLLSASDDHVLRIYSTDQSDPLISLFVAGNDWICWGPEGYYAASPGGERLMGWYVDGGPERLGTFHPAARFRTLLFRPDVVHRLVEAGNLAAALAAADRQRGKASARAALSEILPPVVIITAPDQTSVVVKEPTTEVRFVARPVGKHPITAVRLLVNGRPYPGTEGLKKFDPPRHREVRERWTVRLPAGENTLTVQAETQLSKALSEPVVVTYGARGMVREDREKEKGVAARPALYLLAVGISAYKDKLKLDYAAKDAQTLVKACQKHSKRVFRNVTVKLLTDREATRKAILQGLTWLRKQMTQHDVAVVFFAGHGGKDADGSFFLFPVDVDPDDLLATGVPGDQLKKSLAGMPGRFVVMLDACHAGAVGGARNATPLTDELVRDLATDDSGIVVMCSSMGREFSFEDRTVKHGYFTLALVEGLSGKADYDRDGIIHLNELDLYVTNRVKQLSKGRQHPVSARPTTVRSFPLAGAEKAPSQ